MLVFARSGDTVVVHSMDRLARNLDDLRRIVQDLAQRGVRIEFVEELVRLELLLLSPAADDEVGVQDHQRAGAGIDDNVGAPGTACYSTGT